MFRKMRINVNQTLKMVASVERRNFRHHYIIWTREKVQTCLRDELAYTYNI